MHVIFSLKTMVGFLLSGMEFLCQEWPHEIIVNLACNCKIPVLSSPLLLISGYNELSGQNHLFDYWSFGAPAVLNMLTLFFSFFHTLALCQYKIAWTWTQKGEKKRVIATYLPYSSKRAPVIRILLKKFFLWMLIMYAVFSTFCRYINLVICCNIPNIVLGSWRSLLCKFIGSF